MCSTTKEEKMNRLEEICKNCGCTFGSHHAGSHPWPYNYCPGHEGRMDWDKGPGTIFEPSGMIQGMPEDGDTVL